MSTVLFLHAFPLDARMWRQAAAVVEQAGHRALCPDMPGFGSVPPLDPPSMEGFARHALAALDEAGVEQAVVCGLSMGGYVALRMLELAPQRITGMLLADTRADADSGEVRARRMEQIARIEAEGVAWLADALLPVLIAEQAPEGLREQIRAWIVAAPPAGVIGALRAMAGRPDSTPLLAEIRVPVATVAGERDQLTPPAVMRPMAGQIPSAICTALANSGHLAALEAPEGFSRALLRLLDRVAVHSASVPGPQ